MKKFGSTVLKMTVYGAFGYLAVIGAGITAFAVWLFSEKAFRDRFKDIVRKSWDSA